MPKEVQGKNIQESVTDSRGVVSSSDAEVEPQTAVASKHVETKKITEKRAPETKQELPPKQLTSAQSQALPPLELRAVGTQKSLAPFAQSFLDLFEAERQKNAADINKDPLNNYKPSLNDMIKQLQENLGWLADPQKDVDYTEVPSEFKKDQEKYSKIKNRDERAFMQVCMFVEFCLKDIPIEKTVKIESVLLKCLQTTRPVFQASLLTETKGEKTAAPINMLDDLIANLEVICKQGYAKWKYKVYTPYASQVIQLILEKLHGKIKKEFEDSRIKASEAMDPLEVGTYFVDLMSWRNQHAFKDQIGESFLVDAIGEADYQLSMSLSAPDVQSILTGLQNAVAAMKSNAIGINPRYQGVLWSETPEVVEICKRVDELIAIAKKELAKGNELKGDLGEEPWDEVEGVSAEFIDTFLASWRKINPSFNYLNNMANDLGRILSSIKDDRFVVEIGKIFQESKDLGFRYTDHLKSLYKGSDLSKTKNERALYFISSYLKICYWLLDPKHRRGHDDYSETSSQIREFIGNFVECLVSAQSLLPSVVRETHFYNDLSMLIDEINFKYGTKEQSRQLSLDQQVIKIIGDNFVYNEHAPNPLRKGDVSTIVATLKNDLKNPKLSLQKVVEKIRAALQASFEVRKAYGGEPKAFETHVFNAINKTKELLFLPRKKGGLELDKGSKEYKEMFYLLDSAVENNPFAEAKRKANAAETKEAKTALMQPENKTEPKKAGPLRAIEPKKLVEEKTKPMSKDVEQGLFLQKFLTSWERFVTDYKNKGKGWDSARKLEQLAEQLSRSLKIAVYPKNSDENAIHLIEKFMTDCAPLRSNKPQGGELEKGLLDCLNEALNYVSSTSSLYGKVKDLISKVKLVQRRGYPGMMWRSQPIILQILDLIINDLDAGRKQPVSIFSKAESLPRTSVESFLIDCRAQIQQMAAEMKGSTEQLFGLDAMQEIAEQIKGLIKTELKAGNMALLHAIQITNYKLQNHHIGINFEHVEYDDPHQVLQDVLQEIINCIYSKLGVDQSKTVGPFGHHPIP